MISLFQISSADQSIYYLAQIFGRVGSVLTPATYNALVGNMFRVFNTSVLTLGVVLVIYVTVVGLLKTAQEGEFLGKQWNSLWVPIRTVLGIAALFPTSSGYSAIQIVMLWIIMQGVGAADTLWTTVINYTKAIGGSPLSTITIPSSGVSSTMNTLFNALVCQAAAKGPSTGNQGDIVGSQKKDGGAPYVISYYCNDAGHKNEGFCKGTTDMLNMLGPQSNGANKYSMGPGASSGNNGACGTLSFCDATANGDCASQNSKECIACKAQHTALQAIIPLLGQIAQTMVDADYSYALFYEQPFANPAPPSGGTSLDDIMAGATQYSGPKIISPTPSWVTAYCNAQNPPIPPEKCCSGYPESENNACTGIHNFYALGGDTDTTNLDDGTIKNLYVPYQLKSQLGENIDFMSVAVNQYMTNVVGAVNDYIKNQILNPPVKGEDEWEWTENAINQGWILAGTYYYYMAKLNSASLNAAIPAFSIESRDPKINQSDTRMSTYRNNYSAATALFSGIANQQSQQGGASSSTPAEFQGVTTQLGAAQSGLLHTFMTNLSEGDDTVGAANRGAPMATNAVTRISTFGYALMISAQLLFAVIISMALLLGIFGSLNFMVLGTGLTLNPFWQGVQAVLSVASPFIILMITAIYTLGATLGIYVPLIPFVVFTVGAIGWFIGVIEAMVAAPIVALGILSPGGQHDILGRAEPALMTILNTFLRPTLMIFGLMIAMILANVVVNLINAGFLAATHQIMRAPGLFETILFISAYVSLIVTALNKAFSIIFMLPERVLTWIGGHAVQYGEGEALSTMQRAVEGAAGATAGAGKESGGAAASGAMGQVKARQEAKHGKGDGNKAETTDDLKNKPPNHS